MSFHKQKRIAVIITIALMLSLTGCASPSSTTLDTKPETITEIQPQTIANDLNRAIDLFAKTDSGPEDAVADLMDQDRLTMYLDAMIDYLSQEGIDESNIYDRLYSDIHSLPSWEKLLHDNVENIEYGISNVSIKENKATVKTIITFYDIGPVLKETFDLLYDKAEKAEASYKNAKEEEIQELFVDLFYESFSEALKTTKTPETFVKIKFPCVKEFGTWVIKEPPDELLSQVLFCNLDNALDENITQFGKRIRER